MQLKEYLLVRHNLSSPDQRSIYQYRVTDAEFESLKGAIQLAARLGLVEISTRLPQWDAAFVMYAAEWWWREYDGSSWEWERIFQSFGATAKDLTKQQLYQIVKNGLKYWKRNVRITANSRANYLGTIACEGGLPLKQLTNSGTNGGWLGKVFKQAIPQYIRLQANTLEEASNLISEYEHIIPKTYRNFEIHSILGEMVHTVVKLKKDYQLHNQSNPVNHLDKTLPSWREQFPLDIKDEIGLKLLSEMVKTAANTEESQNIPFRCIRFLDNQTYQLKAQFGFSQFIEIESIFSKENIEKILSRLEVESKP